MEKIELPFNTISIAEVSVKTENFVFDYES